MNYHLDTNVAIAIMADDVAACPGFSRAIQSGAIVALASVVEFELWGGVHASQRQSDNRKRLLRFLARPITILDIDWRGTRAGYAVPQPAYSGPMRAARPCPAGRLPLGCRADVFVGGGSPHSVPRFPRPLCLRQKARPPRFDGEDAQTAAEIRAYLERRGTPIGPYDQLIAAQALRGDATLVTANLDEFRRVPGLRCENWAEA